MKRNEISLQLTIKQTNVLFQSIKQTNKLYSAISFLCLPVFLIGGLLPAAPNYVGSIQAIMANFIPFCAPDLNAVLRDMVGDFFGIALGSKCL